MSIRKRKWRDTGGCERETWVVDVQAVGKDGRARRERRVPRIQTRRAAERLERELRDELLRAGSREIGSLRRPDRG